MTTIIDALDQPYSGTRKPRPRLHPIDRIARNIRVDEGGCWIWIASLNKTGYGTITVHRAGHKSKTFLAHRASYELHNGPIPDGLVLDHLCRVTACVNPDHLEPVTHAVNIHRGVGVAPLNAAKTHCPSGHPYAGDNLYVSPQGARHCRTCIRDAARRYQGRKLSAEVVA